MDETWLKELNKRNLPMEGKDYSKWTVATVSLSSSVLKKLSQKEQAIDLMVSLSAIDDNSEKKWKGFCNSLSKTEL